MVRRVEENELDPEALIQRLKEARTKYTVKLRFKNGREEQGAITYVERLGRGRIIDIEREFAMDFTVQDLAGIDY